MRAAVDLALLEAMRDGLFRRSEAKVLACGNVDLLWDGTGRLHVARSRMDRSAGARSSVAPSGPESITV